MNNYFDSNNVIYTDTNKLYLNDNLITEQPVLDFNSTYKMYLLTTNDGGYPDPRYFVGKIYYFKILDENKHLVRNMIPVKRNSYSVYGMYDLINGVFYTSSGSGSFTGKQ